MSVHFSPSFKHQSPEVHAYVRIRPRTLWLMCTVIALLAIWGGGATWFFLCRDDLVARVLSRQADVQYAYEEQISSMRAQVDRIASRQLLSQDSFEGRVEQLFARQAQLESRHALVVSLAESVGGSLSDLTTGSLSATKPAQPVASSWPDTLGRNISAQPVPHLPVKPAPVTTPTAGRSNKPQPEPIEMPTSTPPSALGGPEQPLLRGTRADAVSEQQPIAGVGGPYIPAHKGVLEHILVTENSLKRIEHIQVKALGQLHQKAVDASQRWRTLISDLGISLEGIDLQVTRALEKKAEHASRSGQANVFDVQLQSVRPLIAAASTLRKAFLSFPIKRPLPSDHDITSHFGHRSDPFTRALAMHSGIDFRGETGSPVKATAAGVVITAHYSGGYGNLVEVEHENGLTTRYAHLSAFEVAEGQKVQAGQTIGRLGSTGRSTAPHLHYEVRINGDAVDPLRFLRVGARSGVR